MVDDAGVERLAAAVLEAAQAAVSRGDWDSAAHLAKEVLVILPADATASALLEVAERRGGSTVEHGRRYLTVLFSDVVGSTPLSERLDPEDYLVLMASYRDVVGAAIARHGGHIDQFQGDGVVAYFGFPTTGEDDQVRAVEAGLDIVHEVGAAGQQHGIDLAARVGIHVGRTVMATADLGARDHSAAIGFAANVAARIQAQADPGTVVISDTAADAVAQYFELRPLPPVSLKGVSDPVPLLEVQAPRALTTRGDVRLGIPLVGREAEQEALDAAWASARDGGDGNRLVVLLGDPGMGKSRLARYATDLAQADAANLIEINCGRALTHVGLGAVRRGIEKALAIDAVAAPGAARAALAERSALVGMSDGARRVLEAMLGETSIAAAAPELVPDRLREAIIRALLEWITAEAALALVVLVVEDLQWADDTAVETIRRLTARPLSPGLMVVLTSRTDGLPGALAGLRRQALELGPLTDQDAAAMVRAVARDEALDADAVDSLVRRSEGVPLYAEHLVMASTAAGLAADALPATLEGLLQARIDASGSGRAVAEVASVVGREFTLEMIERALAALGERSPCRPERAEGALRLLERAGLVESDGDAGRMRFRHSLVRDAAYELQLRSERPHRHRAVAHASMALHGQAASAAALAYHHERAGDLEPAVSQHLRAARQAADLAELDLALHHLRAAGELVRSIDTPSARRLELAQCMQVGAVAAASFSYARDEAAQAYERALELCDLIAEHEGTDLDLDVQLVGALGGLWSKEVVAGDLHAARAVTDRLERLLARTVGGLGSEVHRFSLSCRGFEQLYAGDTPAAVASLEQATEIGVIGPVPVSLGTPHDYVAAVDALLAVGRALQSDDAAADDALDRARDRVRRIPFPVGPFSEAVVEVYAAYVHRLRGDVDAARASAAAIGAVGDRHGFQEHSMLSQILGLAAGALAGDAAACEALESTLGLWRMAGGGLAVPVLLAELAEGWVRAGDPARARRAIVEGTSMLDSTGQRGAEPALVRVAAMVDAAEGCATSDVVAQLVAAAELAMAQGSPRLAAHALRDLRATLPGPVPAEAAPIAAQVRDSLHESAGPDLSAVREWISASV